MISIQNLRKQYGSFTAVDGVDLEVTSGEIHGFLGPNGAGKTTSIKMIAGLLKPTSGRIFVNGHDLAARPEAAKASLGFIAGVRSLRYISVVRRATSKRA